MRQKIKKYKFGLGALILACAAALVWAPHFFAKRPAEEASMLQDGEPSSAGGSIALQSRSAATPSNSEPTPPYVEGQILVAFEPTISDQEKYAIVSASGASIVKIYRQSGHALVAVDNSMPTADWVTRFQAHDDIDQVDLDYLYYVTDVPNDPEFAQLWGLHNDGQTGGVEDVDINAPEAWTEIRGSRDFVIGVIDTGVDRLHSDLNANLWVNPAEIAGNQIDDDGNGYVDDVHGVDIVRGDGDPDDETDHGTHVIGTLAAVGDNGNGVAGVMWDASIVTCKAFDDEGAGTISRVLECYEYFMWLDDSGTEVVAINNSYGGYGYSNMMQDSVRELGDRDIVFVAAAGNASSNNDQFSYYPAGYAGNHVISVAAHRADGRLAEFSNFGRNAVDLAAPGEAIYSTLPGDQFGFKSGTSMATPHVTGAIALTRASDPSLSGRDLRSHLLSTAVATPEIFDLVADGRLRLSLPLVDIDGDQMSDRWEVRFGLDPTDSSDASGDIDNDGLTNLDEFLAKTDPTVADTDNDGLSDGEEVQNYNSDPLDDDSDKDGLSDGDEALTYLTNPSSPDSDADGLSDFDEVNIYGTDPNSADTDGDGLLDGWEIEQDLDPFDPGDANVDSDGDGLGNIDEQNLGTDPALFDSDNDGLSDGDEVNIHATDPLSDDSDGDDISDGWELSNSLDPLLTADGTADNDSDAFSNRAEFRNDTDPNDPNSTPSFIGWKNLQGSSTRTAYVPLHTNVADFSTRWVAPISLSISSNHVVAERSAIFVEARDDQNDPSIARLDAATTQVAWQQRFGDSSDGDILGYQDGKIIALRYGEDAFSRVLVFIDAANGTTQFPQVDLGMRDGRIRFAELPGTVFVSSRNEVSAIDIVSGSVIWRTTVSQIGPGSTGALAIANGEVIATVGASIVRLNAASGQIIAQHDLVDCGNRGFISQLVVDIDGMAVLHCGGQFTDSLRRIDLESGQLLWQIDDHEPDAEMAVDPRHVYSIPKRGHVVALDLQTGSESWSWENQYIGSGGLVVTLDHLFVSSPGTIHAINLETHQEEWLLPFGGYTSLTSDGALTIRDADRGGLILIDLAGDSDGDGIRNWWEQYHGLDIADPSDALADADSDGLSNLDEYVSDTDPTEEDSDGDGLSDADEVLTHGSDPLVSDSDADGLSDGDEINVHGTDPLNSDSDFDGYADGDEVLQLGTDPSDPASLPTRLTDYAESFENGMPAEWTTPNGEMYGFEIVSNDASDGNFSIRSEAMPNGGSAVIEWQANFSSGDLSIDHRIVPRDGTSFFQFYVDGVAVDRRINDSWETTAFPIPSGLHTIRIEFDAGSNETDRGYVDNIRFIQPPIFGSNSTNILAVAANKLYELTPAGELTRQPLPIPFADDAGAIAVTDDHRIVIWDRDQLHFYDPIFGEFERVVLDTSTAAGNSPNSSFAIAAGNIYLGQLSALTELDTFGRWQQSLFPGPGYAALAGSENFIYGNIRNSGVIEKLDPSTYSIVNTITIAPSWTSGFSVTETEEFYSIDGSDTIKKFSASGSVLMELDLDTGEEWKNIDRNQWGYSFLGSRFQSIGMVSDDFSRFTEIQVPGLSQELGVHVAAIPHGGPDQDADGMPDWWEFRHNLDRTNAIDNTGDSDADGLSNLNEYIANSDPSIADTDGDGLSDGDEVLTYGTNPTEPDSDFDGLADQNEVTALFTDPGQQDTDGDGLSDFVETNRFASNPLEVDSDFDGIPDAVEFRNRLDPTDAADASGDIDGDGLSNSQEIAAGSSIYVRDSDGDGLTDFEETNTVLSDPTNPDTDADYLPDGWEMSWSLNPLVGSDAEIDTDGDGFTNKMEFFARSNPQSAASAPIPALWVSDRGTNLHTGFVPLLPDILDFNEIWTTDPVVDSDASLNSVAIDADQVYVTSWEFPGKVAVSALSAIDGSIVWENDFPNDSAVTAPAVIGDNVVVRYNSSTSSANVVSFDAALGAMEVSQQFANHGPTPRAMAGLNEHLLVPPFSRDGLSKISLIDGSTSWNVSAEEVGIGSPLLHDEVVYLHDSERNHLRGYDWETGAPRLSIPDLGSRCCEGIDTSPALGSMHNVISRTDFRLMSFDLNDRKLTWQIDTAGGPLAPVVANGKVFYSDSTGVRAVDERDGSALWQWPLQRPVSVDMLATSNMLFVSSDLEVHAIDVESGQAVWVYPHGGNLSMSRDGHLYIARADGLLTSISTHQDADLDRIHDDWEQQFALDPSDPADALTDMDGDGLTQLEEFNARTNPTLADSDGDGLSDFDELNQYLTNPSLPDTDFDGLSDEYEIQVTGSDPLAVDSDGDGLSDGEEQSVFASSPTNVDSDGDGFSDSVEWRRSSDPTLPGSVPPVVQYFFDSFEAGSLPQNLQTRLNGENAWEVTDHRAIDGSLGISSGLVAQHQSVGLLWQDNFQEGLLSFYYFDWDQGSTEFLKVLIDGQPISFFEQALTSDPRWKRIFLRIPGGRHDVTILLDNSGPGEQQASIDLMTFQPIDEDGDNLPADWEIANGLDPLDAADAGVDSDADGLTSTEEFQVGTSPQLRDTDSDGMWDGWEVSYGLDPLVQDGGVDLDSDGLSNRTEFFQGTSPLDADTDADGIPDGWEFFRGLNPTVNDAAIDMDADGLTNFEEFQADTWPNQADSDNDDLPDGWEVANGFNPINSDDGREDPDNDGLTNGREYLAGTDFALSDTDGDGMPDGWEVNNNLDPLADDAANDPDGDGASNLEEFQAGTDPNLAPPRPPPPPPPPAKKGGGGGATDTLVLAFLFFAAMMRSRPARRSAAAPKG